MLTRFWKLTRNFIDGVTIYDGDEISRLHAIASTQTAGAQLAIGQGVIPRPDRNSLKASAGAGLSVNFAAGMALAIHSANGPCCLERSASTLPGLPASRGSNAPLYLFVGIQQTAEVDSLLEGEGRFFYADAPEQDGAVLLAEVWTGANAVSQIIDRRKFVSVQRPQSSRTVMTSTAVTEEDDYLFVDATAGNITITLLAASVSIRRVGIIRTDGTANTVTVARSGADTINGATSKAIAAQWEKYTFVPNGVNAYGVF